MDTKLDIMLNATRAHPKKQLKILFGTAEKSEGAQVNESCKPGMFGFFKHLICELLAIPSLFNSL